MANAINPGGGDVIVRIGDLDNGFYVEDTGPGIRRRSVIGVFEAGYSTTTDGTGFGLNIVQQVADTHGWKITVSENTDSGTRFEITGVTSSIQ